MDTSITSLHALIVEDSPLDAESIVQELQRVGYEVAAERIDSTGEAGETVAAALAARDWDIVLTDRLLADAHSAPVLQLVQQSSPDVPWVVIVEDKASVPAHPPAPVSACLDKAHLSHLGPSVARALAEAEARREKRLAEEALSFSEERYRTLTESAFDLICEVDHEGNCTYASPNYLPVLGYTIRELNGQPIFDNVHLDDMDAVVSEFTASLAGLRTGQVEYRYQHKNGEWRWFRSHLHAIRDANNARRVVIISRDITERQRHDNELATLISLAKSINAQSHLQAIVRELMVYLQPLAPLDSLGIALLINGDLHIVASARKSPVEPGQSDTLAANVDRALISLNGAQPDKARSIESDYHHQNGNGTNGSVRNAGSSFAGTTASSPVVEVAGPQAAESSAEKIVISRVIQPQHPFWHVLDRPSVAVVNHWKAPRGLADPGIRAYIHVPLTIDGHVLGVLYLNSRQPYVFTEEHVRLAGMVGEQVVVAVRQTQLLEQARRAEEKYRALVNDVNAIVWEADPADFHFTFVSPQAAQWLGFPTTQWLDGPQFWLDRIHEEDRDRVEVERQQALLNGKFWELEYRVVAADGRVLWLRDLLSFETPLAAGPDAPGTAAQSKRLRGIMVDITDQKLAEAEQLKSNALLQATQEAAADGICVVDNLGFVVSYNRRFIDMWHIPSELVEELREKQQLMAYVLSTLQDPNEFINKISALYDDPHASTRDEIHLKDDRIFERYSAPAIAADGEYYGRVWSFSDITERKGFERQLAHQAFHDPLTDLPNRALFMDRLALALARSKRLGRQVAVLFLDLDRFKIVNDSLGHQKGDELLVEVARRLQASVRPTDTAARFGGDEFTILLEEVSGIEDAIHVAERIAASLLTPFHLSGQEVYIAASVGIAPSDPKGAPPDQDEAEDLLRKADIAMYRAKSKGRPFEVFNIKMCAQALDRLQLELDLRQAIKRHQLRLHYQPQVDLEKGHIVGLEALIRWEHPMRGLISPQDFIPLAEETGMIHPIGAWVMREACTYARKWQDQVANLNGYSRAPLRMSVNLSAKQFQQATLAEDIEQILKETGLDPSHLELEITESVVMEDVPLAIEKLEALKRLGVELAIDDFGTGYSSLSYLEHFPLDVLKIDRSFVNQIGNNGDGLAILKAISTLGQTLGVRMIAEGIETTEQLTQLRALDCQIGQGYHFAKPLAADAMEALLHQNPHWQ